MGRGEKCPHWTPSCGKINQQHMRANNLQTIVADHSGNVADDIRSHVLASVCVAYRE